MAMNTRPKEILAEIDAHIPDKVHASAVKAALGPHDLRRTRLFRDLLAVTRDGIASQVAEVKGAWETTLEKGLTDLTRTAGLLQTAQTHLPEPRRHVENRLAGEEGKFLQALGKLKGVGAKVDVVIKLGLDYTEKREALALVWDDLKEDMQDAQEAMDYAHRDIREALDDTITAIAANQTTIYQLALDCAEAIERLPPDVNPVMMLGEIGAVVRWAATLRHTNALQMKAREMLWAREAALRQELAKRGVGIVMFTELRESVKDFVETVNVAASTAAVKEIKETLIKGAQDGCVTEAQKDDMEAFTAELAGDVNDAHEKMVTLYEQFVTRHEDVFYGPVGYRTIEVMLNHEHWGGRFEGVRVSKLHAALRALYDFEYIDAALGSYRGDQQSEVRQRIERELGAAYREIKRSDAVLRQFDGKVDGLKATLARLRAQIQ